MEIDNYQLSLFKDCPKKFEWRVIHKLSSNKPNLPALFGIAIHAGLEHFRKSDSLVVGLEKFCESWKEFDGLDSKGLYTKERGMFILTEYASLPRTFDIKHVEVGMAVQLPHSEHILTGRIDLIAEINGTLHVIDDKTRGKSLSTFCMTPNHQFLGYSYGTKELLGLDRYPPIAANLIKVVKKYNPDDFNLIMTHYPTEGEMEHFFDCVIYWMAKIEECYSFGFFPMKGKDFDCAWCEYRELCVNPELEERLVEEGLYKIDDWEPY